jgi:hypothetical protein
MIKKRQKNIRKKERKKKEKTETAPKNARRRPDDLRFARRALKLVVRLLSSWCA